MTDGTVRIIRPRTTWVSLSRLRHIGHVAEPDIVVTGATSQPGWFGLPVVINMAGSAVPYIFGVDNIGIGTKGAVNRVGIQRVLKPGTHVKAMNPVHDHIKYPGTI